MRRRTDNVTVVTPLDRFIRELARRHREAGIAYPPIRHDRGNVSADPTDDES